MTIFMICWTTPLGLGPRGVAVEKQNELIAPGMQDARVPCPAVHRVGDHAVSCSFRLDGTTFAVAQNDVPHRAGSRWITKEHASDRGSGFFDRNALAETLDVTLPRARVRIRLGGLYLIVYAAVEDAGFLIDQPGHELCTVPRSFPIRVVLWYQNIYVFLTDVLPGPPQQSRSRRPLCFAAVLNW